jgi:hypothetical protein
MSKLTDRIEEELASRTDALDQVFRETTSNLGSLEPKIDNLRDKLGDLDLFMSQHLHRTAEVSLPPQEMRPVSNRGTEFYGCSSGRS